MSRHATLDELARLGADDLRPRKAAKVGRHLAVCSACMQVSEQLAGVPALLSSVFFPEMPETVSIRIGSVLAAEAAQRVAAEPATEAGRRDLPVRPAASGLGRFRPHRPSSGGQQDGRSTWRLPVHATRVVVTAAAILVVGVGGYEIASHAGGAAISASGSSGTHASVPAPLTSRAAVGAPVTYRQGGSTKSIKTLTSGTNFRPSTLTHQAAVAVSEAKHQGVHSGRVASGSNSYNNLAAPTASATGVRDTLGAAAPGSSQLTGCVDRVITPGQVVLLVERARFNDIPATIIVTVPPWASGTNPPKDADIWVVGQACSATNSDVLDHVRVARL